MDKTKKNQAPKKKAATKKVAVKKPAVKAKKTSAKKKPALQIPDLNEKNNDLIPIPEKKPAKLRKSAKSENLPATESGKEIEAVEEIDPEAIARGDHPMTIVEHLDEFRTRFMKVFGAFILLTCVTFYYSDVIVYYINKPFMQTSHQLHIFKLTGGFMVRFKAAAAVSILILIPYVLFHIWRFIAPAIGKSERNYSRLTIISTVLLFYGGVAFVFFLLIPFTIKMFLSFIGSYMITTIGADDYLNMLFIFCLIMGFLFEMPIVIMILTKLGIVTPQLLITKRKYAIITIWIVAAIVSPPDVISQILCGIPLMFLYEISIVISRFMLKRKKRKELQELKKV